MLTGDKLARKLLLLLKFLQISVLFSRGLAILSHIDCHGKFHKLEFAIKNIKKRRFYVPLRENV